MVFSARRDKGLIKLENVFAGSDVSIHSPIHLADKYSLIVTLEGNSFHIGLLKEYVRPMINAGCGGCDAGRWIGFAHLPGNQEKLELSYDPYNESARLFRLVAVVLRESLVRICNLRLLPESRIIVAASGRIFVRRAKLPPYIGNGTIELPPILSIPLIGEYGPH